MVPTLERPVNRAAEADLVKAAAVSADMKRLVLELAELGRRRRRLWLRAYEADGSFVSRPRMAAACKVSVGMVDKELAAARRERQ